MTGKFRSRTARLGIGRPEEYVRGFAVSVFSALLLFTGVSTTAGASEAAHAPASVEPPGISPFVMNAAERSQLERMLQAEIQSTVDRQDRIEGQGKKVAVRSVRFEPRDPAGTGEQESWLIIDLSKSYLPRDEDYKRGIRYISGDFEDLMSGLHSTAYELILEIVQVDAIIFEFDGRDIYHYFPDEAPPEQAPPARTSEASEVSPEAGGIVVAAAGHGYFRHYGEACGVSWCPQRDEHNGVIEDFITPGYADELSHWLMERGQLSSVARPRAIGTELHAESGHPWWKMAARYSLKERYPEHKLEIWGTLPARQTNNRERDEDIRSRPFFANYIEASALLHVHTNGSDNPSANGTRVIYQPGRTADADMGDSILCYAKEIIQAQEGYENYYVPTASVASNEGENRLASMSSVIVEVGFHTNASDATALKDPVFRTAAMKGVEKGYRLYTQGKPCKEFKITDIPDIGAGSNPPGVYVFLLAHYEGFPQLPATVEVEILDCPDGVECEGGTFPTIGEASPLVFPFRCGGFPLSDEVITFRARLTDVDGVKTEWDTSTFTCLGPLDIEAA